MKVTELKVGDILLNKFGSWQIVFHKSPYEIKSYRVLRGKYPTETSINDTWNLTGRFSIRFTQFTAMEGRFIQNEI